MKKIAICLAILMFLIIPVFAFAQETEEVLTLKRDLTQEKMLRLDVQYQLLGAQMNATKAQYQRLKVELDAYNVELEKMKPITPETDNSQSPTTPTSPPVTPLQTGGEPPIQAGGSGGQ